MARRLRCLAQRAPRLLNERLVEEARRLHQCGTFTIIDSYAPNRNIMRGKARCKSRWCCQCQSAQAMRRKSNLLAFCTENMPTLAGYHLYHLTLTAPHGAVGRPGAQLSPKQFLTCFAQLRGGTGGRQRRSKWNTAVAGGAYFLEAPDEHPHVHALLIAPADLHHAEGNDPSFADYLGTEWTALTKANAHGVHLERIYWKDGETKHHYQPAAVPELMRLQRALTAAVGYITKGTKPDKALYPLTAAKIYGLLTVKYRAYGRFGSLYPNAATPSPFTKLEWLKSDHQPFVADKIPRKVASEQPNKIGILSSKLKGLRAGANGFLELTPEELRGCFKFPAANSASKTDNYSPHGSPA